jgi:hypothetical protein
VLTLEPERLRGKFQTRSQIVALKIGKFGQEILEGVASREVFQQRLDGIPQVPDGGFAVADVGVDRDTGKEWAYGHKQAGHPIRRAGQAGERCRPSMAV